MITKTYQSPLYISCLEAALESIVAIEETNLKRTIIKNISKEIIKICRNNRNRIERVDQILEDYGNYISYENKQEIFKIVAETLLFTQYNGVRIKFNQDPKNIIFGNIIK